MKLFKFFFLFLFIFFNSWSLAHSKNNLAFINLDQIIKDTNYGKIILNEIKSLNEKNIKKLTDMENEIKNNENELNNKKNILSENDFENELEILKNKISEYRKIKNEITLNFKNQKNEKLNNFFSKVNPIIQEYMNKNSINILLRQENVFIGKSSADITSIIIEEINIKLN